jgi:hypothetical protein
MARRRHNAVAARRWRRSRRPCGPCPPRLRCAADCIGDGNAVGDPPPAEHRQDQGPQAWWWRAGGEVVATRAIAGPHLAAGVGARPMGFACGASNTHHAATRRRAVARALTKAAELGRRLHWQLFGCFAARVGAQRCHRHRGTQRNLRDLTQLLRIRDILWVGVPAARVGARPPAPRTRIRPAWSRRANKSWVTLWTGSSCCGRV